MKQFLTEMWKENSRSLGIRMVQLSGKSKDSGLTDDEKKEYKRVKEEHDRLFLEYLNERLK